MAVSNAPVLPQIPKSAGISFNTSTQSTEMDPATVAPTVLLTAGSDGSLVTDIIVVAETTVTSEKFVLWKQLTGSGNWFVVLTNVLGAYTQDATDIQGSVKLIDKNIQTEAIRLEAGDVLGITHHVDQQSMITAEYTNY